MLTMERRSQNTGIETRISTKTGIEGYRYNFTVITVTAAPCLVASRHATRTYTCLWPYECSSYPIGLYTAHDPLLEKYPRNLSPIVRWPVCSGLCQQDYYVQPSV